MLNSRKEAGRRLGALLAGFKHQCPCVLALPRGGVPVGFEISEALEAPLDLLFAHKIGAPFQPELAIGAVVDGHSPEILLDSEIIRLMGISQAYIRRECSKQLEEIERQRDHYLAGRPRLDISNRTAIIVDDGIATGATMRTALRAARRAHPKRLIAAVPVAPTDTLEALRNEADDIVYLEAHAEFGSVGSHYADFRQVSDAEVQELLANSHTSFRGCSAHAQPLPSP